MGSLLAPDRQGPGERLRSRPVAGHPSTVPDLADVLSRTLAEADRRLRSCLAESLSEAVGRHGGAIGPHRGIYRAPDEILGEMIEDAVLGRMPAAGAVADGPRFSSADPGDRPKLLAQLDDVASALRAAAAKRLA